MNLTDSDFNHVIRTLERDQRERFKPSVSLIDNKSQGMINQKTGSNYQRLVDEKIANAT